jgi:hypothetical protein
VTRDSAYKYGQDHRGINGGRADSFFTRPSTTS